MLNFNLDPRHYHDAFVRERRLQIHGLLQDEAAHALHACLRDEVPWTLAHHRDEHSRTMPTPQYDAMDAAARQRMLWDLAAQARGRYGFAYESFMMVKAYSEATAPDLLLHRVLEYLNSGEFLVFARTITGIQSIRRVSAQATRYRAGHFLRLHSDLEVTEGRLAAYVINLTPRWASDWGGLLQFHNPDDSIAQTFFPYWNSLSLFKVPQLHSVSGVMPYAEENRMSITGWFQE